MKRHPTADEKPTTDTAARGSFCSKGPPGREPRPTLHAALYGHVLRLQGLSREEAARRVIARYPHTAPLLKKLTLYHEPDIRAGE
jgi:hypothetical protein